MRKHFGIFAAVLTLMAGCAKEISPSSGEQVTVLTAGIETTKTVLDGTKVYWTNGDKISVNGMTSEPLVLDAPSADATFTFNGTLNTPYKAVFPASIYKDENTVTMPSVQEYCENSFHSQASPMLAYSKDNGNLVFSHPFAVVCLYINLKDDADKISYVEFRGNDNEQVCGDFTVDFDELTLTGAGAYAANKSVRVNVGQSLPAEGTMLVHIVVPAQTYSKGFTVKVADENGHYMQKSVPTERVYESGKVYDMKAIDFEPTETELDADLTIASAEELIAFANAWNDGVYTSTTEDPFVVNLTKDIEFTAEDNAEWPGIGVNSDECIFNGVFDGCSNTISGFTSTNSLFKYVATEGLVQNLTLAGDVTYDLTGITATTNAAPFIYRSWGVINDCSSSVNVIVTSSETIGQEVRLSGFMAYMTNGECNGCSYDGAFVWEDSSSSSARAYVGGVIGYVNSSDAKVNGCYLGGTVNLKATVTGDRSWFGGVVGYPLVPVSNCYTTKDAKVNVSNATKLRLGGVVGQANSTVTGCVNNAAITIDCPSTDEDTHTYVGGVVGRNAGKVSESDNTGTITVTTGCLTQRIGGIVGQNYDSDIEDCENSGGIICNDVVVKKVRYYGGIVGYSTGTISSCKNTAGVSSLTMNANVGTDNYSSTVFGGIVAYFSGSSLSDCINSGTVSNQYWNNSNDLTTMTYTGGIAAKVEGKAEAIVIVRDCTNNVSGSTGNEVNAKRGMCGGIIGYADYATITNCDNTMYINGSSYYVGGIVGQMAHSSASDCDAICNIRSTQTKYSGGVAGRTTNGTTTITNCSYDGDIVNTRKGDGVVVYMGAAVGGNTGNLTVSESRFRGNIKDDNNTDTNVPITDVSDAATSQICGYEKDGSTIAIIGNSLIQ